jgi:pilus assembly protein Flp/PilA
MKAKFHLLFPALLCVGLLSLATFMPALAAHVLQTAPPVDPFSRILEIVLNICVNLGALAGVAALLPACVSLLKLIPGLVKDGSSGVWYAGLSLLAIVVLTACQIFKPALALEVLDTYAAKIAMVLTIIGGYLAVLLPGPTIYKLYKTLGLPLIGKSFSKTKALKAQGMVEYALILVLVAVVVIAAVTIMGPLIGNVFSTINASLQLP